MDTQTGEVHVEREAETAGMCLQAKECGGLLATARSRQRGMGWTPQFPPEGTSLLTPSLQASSL